MMAQHGPLTLCRATGARRLIAAAFGWTLLTVAAGCTSIPVPEEHAAPTTLQRVVQEMDRENWEAADFLLESMIDVRPPLEGETPDKDDARFARDD